MSLMAIIQDAAAALNAYEDARSTARTFGPGCRAAQRDYETAAQRLRASADSFERLARSADRRARPEAKV